MKCTCTRIVFYVNSVLYSVSVPGSKVCSIVRTGLLLLFYVIFLYFFMFSFQKKLWGCDVATKRNRNPGIIAINPHREPRSQQEHNSQAVTPCCGYFQVTHLGS